MKARIVSYDYRKNRAVIDFDADFSACADKYRQKDVNIDVKIWRPKRSLAANRYMWVLTTEIARALRTTKDEVYRREIREIGGATDMLLVKDESVERFRANWEAQGLGWQSEVVGSQDGYTTVIAYYGSSTFTTEQMTQLIENLVFEAEGLGINTDTPDKAAWWESLMEEEKNVREKGN